MKSDAPTTGSRSRTSFRRAAKAGLLRGPLAGLWLAAALHAQTGADAQQQSQAAQQNQEKKPAAAPAAPPAPAGKPKVRWTGTLTGGFQFSRGQTNANGVSLMGDMEHATAPRGYRFDGIVLYASVATPGVPYRFVAQDRRNLYFTFYQQIHGPVFFASRTSLEHDVLRDVRVRAMNLSGIGFRLAASVKFQAFVAPGVGLAEEDKPGIRDGAVFTPGVYQRATYHISRIWSIDQWFQYRANPSNSHDYAMDGFAGLTGLIYTTKLGFNFGYIYSYEGLLGPYGGRVVPVSPSRTLLQATIGLRYTL